MGRKKLVRMTKRATPTARIKAMRSGIIPEITKVLIKNQDLHNVATEGWSSRNKPKFPRFINRKRTGLRFGVKVQAPNAKQASISVYIMLNDDRGGGKATKVRKVFLNYGYQRKTIPRRFGQFGKGGYVTGMRSAADIKKRGKKGIDAREWDELAAAVLEPEMTAGIKKGAINGLNSV